ncbi:RNA polymerase sigma factor SigM [compost metagenome]
MQSTTATSSSNVEDRLELKELLDGLEQDHREVIALYYIQDIPVKEIAQILDLSEGTVKSRLYRARSKLATMMNHSSTKEALQ